MNDGTLVTHTTPESGISSVEGDVWEWVVSSERLSNVKRDHLISTTTRRADGVHVRVISDQPPDSDATAVEPTLEDAYLAMTTGESR
nr:hypothetical protein [Halorussus sp. MSC15.2]